MKKFKDAFGRKYVEKDDYFMLVFEDDETLYYVSKSKMVLKKKKLKIGNSQYAKSEEVRMTKKDYDRIDFEKAYKEKFTNYVAKYVLNNRSCNKLKKIL